MSLYVPLHIVDGISFPSCLLSLLDKSREKEKTSANSPKIAGAPSTWKTVKDMFQQNNTSSSAALQHSLEKWEKVGTTFMALNEVILLARKLCCWIWVTYPTRSDQIYCTLLKYR